MKFLDKAKGAWQRWHTPDEVKSFTQDQAEEGAFEHIQRGRQRVSLARIVGSVGRYQDFDGRFRPKQHLPSGRYQGIRQALREGHGLPPVKLYQIKDEYYVLDGNHRIAAAKELGHKEIDATIVEFLPSRNILENLLYRQRANFSRKTSLPYNINLTEVGQYDYLLDQITQHHAYLAAGQASLTPCPSAAGEGGQAGPVTYEAAAMDWYEKIYRPLVAIIRNGDLLKYFPQRTIDDLYVYVSYHQWEEGKKRKYGIGIDHLIPNNMEAFRDKMATQCKAEYPEMLRQITAFVLLNVRGKNESRILEKLFALKEVQEVHAIHGNVDILAKIVLKRDLLSSDAEIISVFVAEQIRQIPGVISTQTLIPGQSKIK